MNWIIEPHSFQVPEPRHPRVIGCLRCVNNIACVLSSRDVMPYPRLYRIRKYVRISYCLWAWVYDASSQALEKQVRNIVMVTHHVPGVPGK